jgi:CIC family chloride channel protein
VMISNTIAYLICRRFQPTPIFDVLTRQDGLELPSMEETREQVVLRVEDAMRQPVGLLLKGSDTVADAASRIGDMTEDPLLVSYETGRWTLVRKAALQSALKSGQGELALREVLPAGRLPRLHPDQALDVPLRLLRDAPFLPVVHRAEPRRLIGILSLEDILAAYRRTSAANVGPAD